MSRITGFLAFGLLFIATAALAQPMAASAPSPPVPADLADSGLGSWYTSIYSPGSCSARPVSVESENGDFLLGISPMADDEAGAEAETFCTRAVDPSCLGCFIGCPSGCWCICGGWFAQCCCDVAAE